MKYNVPRNVQPATSYMIDNTLLYMCTIYIFIYIHIYVYTPIKLMYIYTYMRMFFQLMISRNDEENTF